MVWVWRGGVLQQTALNSNVLKIDTVIWDEIFVQILPHFSFWLQTFLFSNIHGCCGLKPIIVMLNSCNSVEDGFTAFLIFIIAQKQKNNACCKFCLNINVLRYGLYYFRASNYCNLCGTFSRFVCLILMLIICCS